MEMVVEARFDAVGGWFAVLGWVGLVFIVLAVAEIVWDRLTGARPKLAETGANIVIAAVGEALNRTAYGLIFVVALFLAEPFALLDIPMTWWSWLLAILAADLSYYWMHRWEHEVRVLWSYHSVHHSSPEFNLTTAYRLAWAEGLVEWVFFLPMVVLGFDPVQTLVAILVVVLYQTWIHTTKVGRLGWLEGVLNTPSAHRVHHGSDDRYLDRNYGGILMLWDRMFGTYQAEEDPVTFGITQPLNSANPLVINFHEIVAIARDCLGARRLSDIAGYVFGRPGWRPPER